jgi:nucleotide-binding universal stress UspA family protein
MIRNVLVPLDRSALAEQALPPAIAIARRAQGQLHVLHVRTFNPPLAFQHVDWWSDAVLQEEKDYLEAIAAQIKETSGITPVVETREGRVADVIRRHAGNVGADLIVMTTHGRTGLSRLWLGSVADAVVRQDSMPVLMVRPEERSIEMDEHPLYSHVLIPLDGSTAAELALEDAVSLGGLAHARYTLARVVAPVLVPVHSYAMSGAAVRPDEDATSAEMQAAREYLEQQAARLGETGLRVQTTVRLGGHPAETVLSVARDVQADLIAMCTQPHGAARFIMGSVADKVLRGGDLPLLLMRPRGAAGG